jgi:hypothetical protein
MSLYSRRADGLTFVVRKCDAELPMAEPESQTAFVGAARISWVLVCGAVALLGLFARLPQLAPPRAVLLFLALAAAAAGLALGLAARRGRQAVLGAAASGLVLLILGVAALSGAAARRTRAAQQAAVARASAAAPLEGDGWYGARSLAGAGLFVLELDRDGSLGRMITDNFEQRFIPLVVGVDNRSTRPMVLNLDGARLILADGSAVVGLDRGAVLEGTRRGRDEARRLHGGPYRVGAGQSLGNALLFVPPGTVMKEVVSVTIELDGASVTIPGRLVTAAEKRAPVTERLPR